MTMLKQTPEPGSLHMRYRGDVQTIRLALSGDREGSAFVRTNIGRAHIRRREIIRHVETGEAFQCRDWHDVPMRRLDGRTFEVDLPLAQTGRFEAKACFIPEGETEPHWPGGGNAIIKVEPAFTVCANTLYTAFVRQFGPGKSATVADTDATANGDAMQRLDHAGYTVIPRSGTFRDLIKQLDFIIGKMGFRIVQLLPIHPVPTTYARMGRFGSPFAALDFMDVDPAYAEFDRRTTPLDQFRELADAVHARHARLFIDLPINHTGWASFLQNHHPEWFRRSHDEAFQSPGAWGVTWEDLSELDYASRRLWEHMAGVFLFWCARGVDGFRCDAGYMVPEPVWTYIVARVREQFPETVFLLEGLGGKISVMERLLTEANLNWAYSELFQCADRSRIEAYMAQSRTIARTRGTLIHFAETHDNNRLAAVSHRFARMRTALAALLSDAGAFGITNGVEWHADRKVDVHGAPSLNWGADDNQVDAIRRLNVLLATHPCFHAGAEIALVERYEGNVLAVRRRQRDRELLVLVNLDADTAQPVQWEDAGGVTTAVTLTDLLDGGAVSAAADGNLRRLRLDPAQVRCLSADAADLTALEAALQAANGEPPAGERQRQRALIAQLATFFHPHSAACDADRIDADIAALAADPAAYCATVAARPPVTCVTPWDLNRDARRVTPLPTCHVLLLRADIPFEAHLTRDGRTERSARSFVTGDGRHAAMLVPPLDIVARTPMDLRVTGYENGTCRHETAGLLLLPDAGPEHPCRTYDGEDIRNRNHYALLTNGRGAMSQVRLRWGQLYSQYDGLLVANLHPDHPVDRHMTLRRCRCWLVHRGYSSAIDDTCMRRVDVLGTDAVCWHFTVPAGLGRLVALDITLRLHAGRNAVTLAFARGPADSDALAADHPVRIVVRPDIEDRNAHHVTKAFMGAEQGWRACCRSSRTGFTFEPAAERRLIMTASRGVYTHEPEWQYVVQHPFESARGLEAQTDVFSPGFFAFDLVETDTCLLNARAGEPEDAPVLPSDMPAAAPARTPDETVLRDAIRQFVVTRDISRTIIAGYPWFLDWGRDTFICLRGIIAAGMHNEARDILIQFARFERNGTLPNMIRGNDDSNRDTSDAPLWFFQACADFIRTTGKRGWLDTMCGGRTVREVLRSLATHYRRGTPNGIRMDPESGLVFSPSHYTWMDTNYPAGTPREGYPIEIQALWHAALTFLAQHDDSDDWGALAQTVAASIATLYARGPHAWLSDCLHAPPGTPARDAVPDDHLRCNQLLAVTLGAIGDNALARRVIDSATELLVPGAIRSLADRPVAYELPVFRDGRLLNAPAAPYWSTYAGDEDTRRKPAYHNGTAWTWPFPSYAEALVLCHGACALPTARAILASAWELLAVGCVNQIPEVTDGNAPHRQRGCGAQAWGVTELYRVLRLLRTTKPASGAIVSLDSAAEKA